MSLHRVSEMAGPEAPLYAMMAQQRRAQFLRKMGFEAEAEAAATTAAHLALRWGSPAFVAGLRADFNLPVNVGEDDSVSSGSAVAASLESILELGAAAARETDRVALSGRIMTAVLKVANADHGSMVLLDDARQPHVAATADLTGPLPNSSAGIAGLSRDAQAAVEFCLRSGQPFSLDKTRAPVRDKALLRSSLCVPLLHGGTVIGALYLENNVSRHAFGPGRMTFIRAIANQAGITLEGERLVSQLRVALERQTRQTEANRRFVPEYLMRELGADEITEVGLNLASETELTVVFVDLRGFTAVSQKLGASGTIRMINCYLEHVQPGIAAYGGFVGNYLGDGLLALFPGGGEKALYGVSAMARGLAGYNSERGDLPQLDFGMGVHRGKVTIGMIGDRDHIQCGVLGDTVNVASRLQNLTKELAAKVIISRESLPDTSLVDSGLLRSLGKVTLRGRSEEVEVFEYLDVPPQETRESIHAHRHIFAEALALKGTSRVDEARSRFLKCAALSGNDPVAQAMAMSCVSVRP